MNGGCTFSPRFTHPLHSKTLRTHCSPHAALHLSLRRVRRIFGLDFGPNVSKSLSSTDSGRLHVFCTSRSPPPGERDSRNVLDAFFLGKAFAEALNERLQSTVGEVLSAVGRFQAEQQRQIEDFQEEVLERAKNSRDKAAREALEAQGQGVAAAIDATPPAASGSSSSVPASAASSSTPAPALNSDKGEDSVSGVSNDN